MPEKKRLCTYGGCRVIVTDGSSRCQAHPRVTTPAKNKDWHRYNNRHIYDSSQWKKARLYKITRDPLCEDHLLLKMTVAATEIDHVIEIEDGGDIWNYDNHRSLCRDCHAIKTGREARKRARRKQLNGFNVISDF